jgi:predicted aminopeptidase
LYKSGESAASQRQEKQGLIQVLEARYQTLLDSWNGEKDFQYWMSSEVPFSEINNAKLGTIADYHDWVPAFHVLLSDHDGDLTEFAKAVSTISKLSREARDELLREKSS